jgi:hypothetical protein
MESCKSDDDRCSLAEGRFVSLRAAAAADDPRTAEIVNRGVNQAVRYVAITAAWRCRSLACTVADPEGRWAIAETRVCCFAAGRRRISRSCWYAIFPCSWCWTTDAPRCWGRMQSFMLFAIDHRGVSLFAAPYAERPHHESEAICRRRPMPSGQRPDPIDVLTHR